MTQTLVQLLNQPFVHRVGNHRQPATDSMIEYGLSAEKATAYDFDVATSGHSSLPKSLRYEDGCTLVFAGSLIKSKGCEDVILAVAELLRRGQKTRLTIFGDGPERQKLEQLSLKFPAGTVTVRGRRPNEEVLEAMRTSTFVCVTTHSEFPEGMPLALTESLSSGTPVIASMHPVFVRAFRNGEGLQFVPEKQPNLIADAIWQLWNDRTRYDQLSRLTLSALERVRCTTLFADLLQEWKSQRLIDAGFLDVAWERHSAVLPQECQHTTGDEINPFTA